MRSECFSTGIFAQWLLYGLWHAVIIFFTTMFVLSNPETHQWDGKDIGFWVSGMAVYGSCVFVANAVVATRMHGHNWFSMFFFILMFLGYFACYWVFSFQGYIYGIFFTQLAIGLIWLTFMFNALQVFATEMIYTSNQEAFDNCGDWILHKLGQLTPEEFAARKADRAKYFRVSN